MYGKITFSYILQKIQKKKKNNKQTTKKKKKKKKNKKKKKKKKKKNTAISNSITFSNFLGGTCTKT
jgi:chromosomal replication initiation ATPase DnaA